MEDKTKTIQDPNTPRYNTTSGLLTDYGKSLGLKEVNIPTTINSSNLTPTNGTKLPPQPGPTDTSSINNAVNETLSAADAEKKAFMESQTKSTTDIGKLLETLGQEGAMTKSSAIESGAYDRLREYDQYTADIEREQKAIRDRVKNFEKTFTGTTAGLSNAIDKMNRESASYQADLAISQNVAGRNYDRAMAIAKDKVEIELAPKKAELAKLQYIYDNNKPFQTAEFTSILNRKQKEIDKEQENKDLIASYSINAMRNDAPASIKNALANAKTIEEVNKIPGIQNYISSPEDKLDLEIKRLQKEKLSKEISGVGATEAPTIKTINGVDMQWNGSAWVPATTTTGVVDIKKAEDQVRNLDFLKSTAQKASDLSRGAGRTGVHEFVGGIFTLTEKKRLGGLSDTLKSNILTMAVDPNIKKFFGPQMTENDVRMMTATGTTLNPDTQTAEDYKEEVTRVYDMLNRAQKAVQDGIRAEQLASYIDYSGTAIQTINSPYIK
jgi:hypothetical protein